MEAQVKVVEARAYSEDGTLLHPQLLERYQRRARGFTDYVGNEQQYVPMLQAHFDLVLEAVAAVRTELPRLHRAGEIEDRVMHELERDLDLEELAAQSARAG